MKQILICTVVAMAFGGAFANESSATNAMDMAARKAAASKRFHERTGGFVVDVQKTKGGIYFVNAAGEAFSKDLAHAAQTLQNDSWLPCKTATAGDVTIMNINEKMSHAKWNVAIVLVSNDMLPMTIIQPEGRWAFINIEALKKGNPSEKILSSRVKKSALRAAAFVFGCGYSLNAGGIATPIAGVEGCRLMCSPRCKRWRRSSALRWASERTTAMHVLKVGHPLRQINIRKTSGSKSTPFPIGR